MFFLFVFFTFPFFPIHSSFPLHFLFLSSLYSFIVDSPHRTSLAFRFPSPQSLLVFSPFLSVSPALSLTTLNYLCFPRQFEFADTLKPLLYHHRAHAAKTAGTLNTMPLSIVPLLKPNKPPIPPQLPLHV